ncbi:glycosyl transferase [Leptospira perolatii]|uniref:Glycosyl transferase n=1 Tax=Leptospira perolatii TaxID=2023191 RepID=A0A2M9ZMW0_9LEPT|nr:glycosyltransferase family 1 protein [Leptospira perolatii]PJZ70193.1 glycosyl transferase [Leptospira perolatii]PJZ73412.1 glycosyl transferase [Leptospira perolatii]
MGFVRKYRIGVDARPFSTPVSGVGRLIESLISGFVKDPRFEFILFTHKEIHPSYTHLLKLPNIKVEVGKGFLAKKGGIYFALLLPIRLWKKPVDIFWGTQQVFPLFLSADIPGVLTYHDLVAYRFPSTMRPIARYQQYFYLERSAKRAEIILANSKATAKEVSEHFEIPKDKIRVVYPNLNLETKSNSNLQVAPSSKTKNLPKKFMLSVSTVEPRKNFGFLKKAYDEYRNLCKEKGWLWVHAGKAGWESPEFLKQLRKDSESGKILWIDSPSDLEVQYLYSRASLFLFPSLYEGFGIPLLEALNRNLPCIVSDLEVFHEIAGKSALYLSIQDPKVWSKAMLDFTLKRKKLPKPNLKKFDRTAAVEVTKEAFLNIVKL